MRVANSTKRAAHSGAVFMLGYTRDIYRTVFTHGSPNPPVTPMRQYGPAVTAAPCEPGGRTRRRTRDHEWPRTDPWTAQQTVLPPEVDRVR
jgi:hypothetical protein